MSKVIMLLPYVDRLQLANCHKYVTRTDNKRYDEIYTSTTIAGRCTNVDKILVIGHGGLGRFIGATPGQVADALLASGIPQTDGRKIAFDCCYAGAKNTSATDTRSALDLLAAALRRRAPKCKFTLVGATGCTVTVGGDKRLVVSNAGFQDASNQQNFLVKLKKVDLGSVVQVETRDSATLKRMAMFAFDALKQFAVEFRDQISDDIETGPGRKVHVAVG